MTPNELVPWAQTYSKLSLLMLRGYKVAIIFALLDNTQNIIFALMMDNWDKFYYTSDELNCTGDSINFIQVTEKLI